MSGMTDKELNEIEEAHESFKDAKIKIHLSHDVVDDLIAEIRRLREENERYQNNFKHWFDKAREIGEENERLQQELKGIGAEQYYSMRQRFWDEQKKNVALHKEVMRLERKHYDDTNNYRSDVQTWQEDYERQYVDLAKQNAELAEVLRKSRDEMIGIGFFRLANRLGEVLRKYGLEGEQ